MWRTGASSKVKVNVSAAALHNMPYPRLSVALSTPRASNYLDCLILYIFLPLILRECNKTENKFVLIFYCR